MKLSLSEEKVQKILMRCQKTLDQKASSTGFFLTEIIKRGQCSSTTFKKFYHKEIVNRDMFQNIINSASVLQEKLLVAMRVCFC